MKSLPRIGLQLANLGQAGKPNSNRLRNIGYVSILLTILSLFFYSQSFEEEEVHLKPASQSLHSGHGVLDVTDGHDRPLIVYAYSETDDSKENFKFFLKRGLHAAADFIFVFNGPTTVADLVPTHLENVRVVERDNTCYDIGAVGEVLAKDDLWKKYKRFITMNASVRGPFMPVWSKECWTDTLLRKITDKVKLVGLTYNCRPVPHVQSMVLATDDIGMGILLDPELAYSVPFDSWPHGGAEDPVGFSQCYSEYTKAVHSEIGMAALIRSKGYKVDVMLTSVAAYTPDEYCDKMDSPDDHLMPGGYFGYNVHPYETIFPKGNHKADKGLLDHMTEWHYNMNDTSWNRCGR